MINSLADIVVKAGEWQFEPNTLFRSGLDGEDWPIGYISAGPGKPIFALHEVLGELTTEELNEAAALATSAPTLATLVLEAREALAELIGEELGGDQREPSQREETDFYRPVLSWAARRRARATLAKLESL